VLEILAFHRAFVGSKNSKVGFIRWFGGCAALAARQSLPMIFASSKQMSLKGIEPTSKQRIPPGRSAGSLPRFLGESAAAELTELTRRAGFCIDACAYKMSVNAKAPPLPSADRRDRVQRLIGWSSSLLRAISGR
jgi:hypothetical protein